MRMKHLPLVAPFAVPEVQFVSRSQHAAPTPQEPRQPIDFALNQVIAGWTEGVSMMPVGAKYRFWIPGDLAYGARGTPGGPIGPNQMLIFDVELLDIVQ